MIYMTLDVETTHKEKINGGHTPYLTSAISSLALAISTWMLYLLLML